jgi:hypothetical protein
MPDLEPNENSSNFQNKSSWQGEATNIKPTEEIIRDETSLRPKVARQAQEKQKLEFYRV